MIDRIHKVTICHPERPKKIADFRRESKDLPPDLTETVSSVCRFFDFADAPLRMTDLSGRALFRHAE